MENYNDHYNLFKEYLQIERNASPYTVKYYLDDLEFFFTFLNKEGINNITDIDQTVVRLFLTDLYEQKLSRRSVSRRISSLRSFYKVLERDDSTIKNPFIHISLPKTSKSIPNFLYMEELKELFQNNDLSTPLGRRNQALLETIYSTGIRVSECAGLVLDDIDFSLGTMLIRGKGQKERYVLFGQFAKDALESYINTDRISLLENGNTMSDSVFLNARGAPLTPRGIRYILNKIVENASLTIHVHPHKLRHTFATHMLNEGADLRAVQELLGHENLSSTQIYTHVTKDHLQNVYMNSHPRARLNTSQRN